MATLHWASIKEHGSSLGMDILLKTYALGGRPLFQLCLFPVILFYSLFHPVAGRASRQYRQRMATVNKDFPKTRPWHRFVHLWHFGNTLLDKLSVWMGNISPADVDIHHGHIIDDLLARRQGAIILISHLGNFEICQAFSENRPALQLCVLQHTKNAEKFNRLLKRHNRETRVDFMQVGDLGVAQAMVLSDRLSQGHFIAISADRVPLDNESRTLMHPFLGLPASFPIGPFNLAISLQCPLLSVQCTKQQGRYQIDFETLWPGGTVARAERKQVLQQLLSAYVDNLERHCRQAPWQWYNFYPFWKDTP
jgi:predicted LPLAT superfamily acyltransferase